MSAVNKALPNGSSSEASTSNGIVKPPFDTVLVANRGEIAVRIIKTLKKLKIKSVAVYSDHDKYAQHVLQADVAIALNGTTSAQTYLDVEKIIDAAKCTGSQAIVPGYGFLSENANFAEACENNGIIFVGPSAQVIRSLGLKHSAREIAKNANVPLVPGSEGLLKSLDEALSVASKLGYPLMIKSTAGGGGIGLQRVDNEDELRKAYDTVQHQALSYFSDAGIFLERFVQNARHIEIQVFGDGRGKAIALGERDCSLQRRNQKVIEETPAPRLPEETRMAMRQAAERLASYVKYACAGTVEYIYEEERDEFYFLEVNTRLQVEHPITEMATGLDLVEWMVLIASGNPPDFSKPIVPRGASMEARVYAENPVKDFTPSPGQITTLEFPKDARVDTWVTKGTNVTAEYDPTVAKIIVYGEDRDQCLAKFRKALNETYISGIVTNIDYLRSIAESSVFEKAEMTTRTLNFYNYTPNAIEVLNPGSHTSIQDFPGRKGLWHIGVPPSGPMDDYSFRIANRLVGNHESSPAIECTLIGPTLVFHTDSVIALTGGSTGASIEGLGLIEHWKAVSVKAGSKLELGKLKTGCRTYLAVRGGIDVPEYLGSRSTFTLGKFGGHNGRVFKFGDILTVGKAGTNGSSSLKGPVSEPIYEPISSNLLPAFPQTGNTWRIGVTVGPHGAPDFFTDQDVATFFSSEWKVHYNSNRFGVRLVGPKPTWARKDGGEAGLHPSNQHDYVYAPGAINFTGDEPVILTNDGPSLGGFVCPAVVVEAEKWKLGQLKPGDRINFVPVTYELSVQLKKLQDIQIESLSCTETLETRLENAVKDSGADLYSQSPILVETAASNERPKIVYRQSGDRFILVEFGENEMDLKKAYLIHRLIQRVTDSKTEGVVEMSRGVRSVLVEFETQGDGATTQQKVLTALQTFNEEVESVQNWKVPSRVFRLPMAFEDKETLDSVQRYHDTIRSNAPWLPNNVDFLTKINSLPNRDAVRDILYAARYLVLGLGDVFLGAPCAVPLDPRHRLLGTKYNPSRSFTPNGTVGIGGMYMCIYTSESPGGYQLVGRTIPIWDKLSLNTHTNDLNKGNPWLLSPFDQIEFYPVSEPELEQSWAQVENGHYNIDVKESEFDFGQYTNWLKENESSIKEFREAHQESSHELFTKLMKESDEELARQQSSASNEVKQEEFSEDAVFVYGEVAGRMWKSLANVGDVVEKGNGLIVVEAMKTEMVVNSSVTGKVVKLVHKNGDFIDAGDMVAVIEPVTKN